MEAHDERPRIAKNNGMFFMHYMVHQPGQGSDK